MDNPSRDARPVPAQDAGRPAGKRRGGRVVSRGGWYIFVPVLSLGSSASSRSCTRPSAPAGP